MRLLNLIQCTNLGGTERASFGLMQELKKRGHEVEVLSLNPLGDFAPILASAGIPATGLPYCGRGGWKSVGLLRRELQQRAPDALIMTGHNLLASVALGNMCRGHRVLAIHFHHAGVKPSWQWRLIYRVACARFDAITFPSNFVRNEAEALYPNISSRAHTVRYPVALGKRCSERERANARAGWNLPRDATIIGNAGWLIPRQRFDIFLHVAAEVSQSIPNSVFLIAGDGTERDRLKGIAAELNLSDRVRWIGWQTDMTPFYNSLDVLLFNSDFDAMGLTALESISHGVPVVASVLNGGLREIITNKVHATLLDRHDVPEMARAIVEIVRNPAEGVAQIERAHEQLLTIGNAIDIADTYERLLGLGG